MGTEKEEPGGTADLQVLVLELARKWSEYNQKEEETAVLQALKAIRMRISIQAFSNEYLCMTSDTLNTYKWFPFPTVCTYRGKLIWGSFWTENGKK